MIKIGSIYRVISWMYKEESEDRDYNIILDKTEEFGEYLVLGVITHAGDHPSAATCTIHKYERTLEYEDGREDPDFKMIEVKSEEQKRDAFKSILSCENFFDRTESES